jgi:hypothetical protein
MIFFTIFDTVFCNIKRLIFCQEKTINTPNQFFPLVTLTAHVRVEDKLNKSYFNAATKHCDNPPIVMVFLEQRQWNLRWVV